MANWEYLIIDLQYLRPNNPEEQIENPFHDMKNNQNYHSREEMLSDLNGKGWELVSTSTHLSFTIHPTPTEEKEIENQVFYNSENESYYFRRPNEEKAARWMKKQK